MNKEMYSLFDKKAEQFGIPMFVPSLPPLLRDLRDELKKGTGMLSVHPEDFALFRLGSFDDVVGTFDIGIRVKVCEVVSLVDVPA